VNDHIFGPDPYPDGPVCTENSDADVVVMQSTEEGVWGDAAGPIAVPSRSIVNWSSISKKTRTGN